MLAVRTECQPKKITLMRLFAEPRVRIVEDLIRLEVKHGNGLLGQRFLRAIAVVRGPQR